MRRRRSTGEKRRRLALPPDLSSTRRYRDEHARKKVLTFCEAHRTLRAFRLTDPWMWGDHLVYPCRWDAAASLGPRGGLLHWHIGRPGPEHPRPRR